MVLPCAGSLGSNFCGFSNDDVFRLQRTSTFIQRIFLCNPCFLQCYDDLRSYLCISQVWRFVGYVWLLPGDRRRAIYPKTWSPTEGWVEFRALGGQGGGVICHLAPNGRQAAVVEAVGHTEALGRRFGAIHLKTHTEGAEGHVGSCGCTAQDSLSSWKHLNDLLFLNLRMLSRKL